MSKNVWMCKAYAQCDNCDVNYNSNNAMALMAKHCKKTGHTADVSMCYAIDYSQSLNKPKEDKNG